MTTFETRNGRHVTMSGFQVVTGDNVELVDGRRSRVPGMEEFLRIANVSLSSSEPTPPQFLDLPDTIGIWVPPGQFQWSCVFTPTAAVQLSMLRVTANAVALTVDEFGNNLVTAVNQVSHPVAVTRVKASQNNTVAGANGAAADTRLSQKGLAGQLIHMFDAKNPLICSGVTIPTQTYILVQLACTILAHPADKMDLVDEIIQVATTPYTGA